MGKKLAFLTTMIVSLCILSACIPSVWVLEEERLGEVDEVQAYVERLQGELSDFRGYELFTIAEGKKMLVVSTGSNETELSFGGFQNSAHFEFNLAGSKSNVTSVVTVVEENMASDNVNSYIVIGVDKLKDDFIVLSDTREEFKHISAK